MAKQIKKRSEIDDQYKWRLTDIYPSDEAWEKDYARLEGEVKSFAALDGRVADDPRDAIRRYFGLAEQLGMMGEYAFLRRETDNGDPAAQAIADRANALMVRAETAAAFLQPELLALDDATLRGMMDDPAMAEFSEYLRGLIRE